MVLDQQVRLPHLSQLTGVHDRANQPACSGILHESTTVRRFNGTLHLWPNPANDGWLDVSVEFRMGGVLVRKKLS
jgi:hypothetical protein